MLSSVQAYTRNLLDGLVLPGQRTPLVCYITPPMFEKITGPRAYVWGGRVRGGRQTAPRGPGFMRIPWTIDTYLSWSDTPDDAVANEPFPRIIDTVLAACLASPMPFWLSEDGADAGPNQVSETDTQIQAFCEGFELDYPNERAQAQGRMLWYTARLGIDVLEVIRA